MVQQRMTTELFEQVQRESQLEAAALEEALRQEVWEAKQKREQDLAARKTITTNMLVEAESKLAAATAQKAAELKFNEMYMKV
jgi:hypothetical protein